MQQPVCLTQNSELYLNLTKNAQYTRALIKFLPLHGRQTLHSNIALHCKMWWLLSLSFSLCA